MVGSGGRSLYLHLPLHHPEGGTCQAPKAPTSAHSGQCEEVSFFYKTFKQQICIKHLLGARHCATSRGRSGEESTRGPWPPGVEGLAEEMQKLLVLNV